MINGSPHPQGNTRIALDEVANALAREGIESEILWIGNKPMQGCIACGKCKETGRCVFHDEVYEKIVEFTEDGIDGLIVGSPVYYAGPAGSLCALLDRVFYSIGQRLAYKPAASVSVARRGGATTTFDRLNKYFTIVNMPIAGSQYWTIAYGCLPGEVRQDEEGMQTMRTLGRNMAWMIKCLDRNQAPEKEASCARTNFIR